MCGAVEFFSSVCYGRSVGWKALREEIDSWSPNRWVCLGHEWTVNEVSKPEETLSEIGMSEREEGSSSEVDESGCACWCNNAETEIDVDLGTEEDDVCIGPDLKIKEWNTDWEEDVDPLFGKFLGSLCRNLSTEEVECIFDDSLGYNKESLSELFSEAVFRLGFAEVDGSSIWFCKAEVVGLSQNLGSSDFRCLRHYDFLASVLVGGASGNIKRG